MRKYHFPDDEERVEAKEIQEDVFEKDIDFKTWTKMVRDYDDETKRFLEKEVIDVQQETENFKDKIQRHDTVRKVQKRELLRNTNADFKNDYKDYIAQRPKPEKLEKLYSKISNILGVPPITESNSAIYDSYALSKTNDKEKMRLRYLVSKLEKEYRKSRKREKFLMETAYYFSKIIYKQQKYVDSLKKMYTQRELQVLKLKDLASRINENRDDKAIFKDIN